MSETVPLWRESLAEARSEIADSLFPELSDPIRDIVACEVVYVMNPVALPYRNLRFAELNELMTAEYGFTFVPEPIADLANVGDLRGLGIEELGRIRLTLPEPDLAFENGLRRMPDARAVLIRRIEFRRESVFCSVVGPTEAGDQLIQEVIPMLWALIGVRRTWEDLKKDHQVVNYGTATRVLLPGGALLLLSDSVTDVLNKWTSPGGLAEYMGGRTRVDRWEPPEGGQVRFTLEELEILFHRMSPTGYSETSTPSIFCPCEA
jgi:hypothetical protein